MVEFLLAGVLEWLLAGPALAGEMGPAYLGAHLGSAQTLNVPLSDPEEVDEGWEVSHPAAGLVDTGRPHDRFLEVERGPVLADLYFDETRSDITGAMKVFLQDTVDLLHEELRWGLRLEGHCDSRGTSAYNLARAQYHLKSLTRYLHHLGFSSERIQYVNFGQTPLSCRSGSERCQEDNLRAERIFSILAVDRFQRGCLSRIRLIAGPDTDRAAGYLKRSPFLQRIQVASPRLR